MAKSGFWLVFKQARANGHSRWCAFWDALLRQS